MVLCSGATTLRRLRRVVISLLILQHSLTNQCDGANTTVAASTASSSGSTSITDLANGSINTTTTNQTLSSTASTTTKLPTTTITTPKATSTSTSTTTRATSPTITTVSSTTTTISPTSSTMSSTATTTIITTATRPTTLTTSSKTTNMSPATTTPTSPITIATTPRPTSTSVITHLTIINKPSETTLKPTTATTSTLKPTAEITTKTTAATTTTTSKTTTSKSVVSTPTRRTSTTTTSRISTSKTTTIPSETSAPVSGAVTTTTMTKADQTTQTRANQTSSPGEFHTGVPSPGAICAGVIVPVAVLVGVFLVIALVRARRRRRPFPPDPLKTLPPSGDTSPPARTISRPQPLGVFQQHVEEMGENEGYRYADEFNELKQVNVDGSHSVADQECNRKKNRYANIKPYDVSLVQLMPLDDASSTYINANWMPGYDSRREYIATQGPLPATRDDFWRMIWEYNCRGIVMVTNCVEFEKTKCDHYWPHDSDPVMYGDVEVKVINEHIDDEFILKDIVMSLGSREKYLRHIHYHIWKDMDVPEDHESVLRFLHLVNDKVLSGCGAPGPLVVHCSAGVGRTGTFIALDTLLRQVRNDSSVDIFGVVYKLRMNRTSMVQTKDQYIFLHKCIAHEIEKRDWWG